MKYQTILKVEIEGISREIPVSIEFYLEPSASDPNRMIVNAGDVTTTGKYPYPINLWDLTSRRQDDALDAKMIAEAKATAESELYLGELLGAQAHA